MSIEFYSMVDHALSASNYQLMQFPAGEYQINLADPSLKPGKEVAVVKGANANDYLALQMWSAMVHNNGGTAEAVIPYLPGARADHLDRYETETPGAIFYAGLITEAELDRVICFDPHSNVMPTLIQSKFVSCTSVSPTSFVLGAFKDIEIAGLIVPDKGAKVRSEQIARWLEVPTFQASKKRDGATGKLSGFECEPITVDGLILIVDDICDGGGTFAGIADATGLPEERLALWVSHGIFSAGSHRLGGRFSKIFTTDSIEHHSKMYDKEFPLTDYLASFL